MDTQIAREIKKLEDEFISSDIYITSKREINSGIRLELLYQDDQGILNIFNGKKGVNPQIQCPNNGLKYKLIPIINELYNRDIGNKAGIDDKAERVSSELSYVPYKYGIAFYGDNNYFGPLIGVGIFFTPETYDNLNQAIEHRKNVNKKNKKNRYQEMKTISEAIKILVEDNMHIVALSPESYNKFFRAVEEKNTSKANSYSKQIIQEWMTKKINLHISSSTGSNLDLTTFNEDACELAKIIAQYEVMRWFKNITENSSLIIMEGMTPDVLALRNKLLSTVEQNKADKLIKLDRNLLIKDNVTNIQYNPQ